MMTQSKDQISPERTSLEARNLVLGYGSPVIHNVDFVVPEGKITIIVGANGCGKSTFLRGLSRLLTPIEGDVFLDQESIHKQNPRTVARKIALLPQHPIAPDGITVRDLIMRGRFPHQGIFSSISDDDRRVVEDAIRKTGVGAFADANISELSGGQRQRAWIAMTLAQETNILLLDEPTTFLDLTHQIEVLDLVKELNSQNGTTVVIVLHDLNLAARYADHLVAMKSGRIHAQGNPSDVVTESLVKSVFNLEATVIPDPETATPLIIPHQKHTTISCSPVLAFPVQVLSKKQLSPHLLRITFNGTELTNFGCTSEPLDTRIKLVIPGSHDHLMHLRASSSISKAQLKNWYKTWLQVDENDRGWLRTYSVRDFRKNQTIPSGIDHYEVDVDFVVHSGGRASSWAQAAQVGDEVVLLGPNKNFSPEDYAGIEFRPGKAKNILLAGDATALPAIASILKALDDSYSGHAFIHVLTDEDVLVFDNNSNVQIHWITTTETDALSQQIKEELPQVFSSQILSSQIHLDGNNVLTDIDVDQELLWETTLEDPQSFFAWIAGEANEVKTIRRYLVQELGIDRKNIAFMGYWRRGRAEN
ncbi:ATP-binding cassette domain-containing protein [Arcanobacterium ihumii]|uniref:ATP-binding cassette domain-containing protein n=1 Tax=Arcanobacterium ihumii TaxID=2138162 RepID=UPI00190FA036|nr:ATP-binding cassette domain-containing protein [Arcanobacterium ihumii]